MIPGGDFPCCAGLRLAGPPQIDPQAHPQTPPGESARQATAPPGVPTAVADEPTEARPAVPSYVYVASSWRNPIQQAVVHTLRAARIDCYDFRNPEGGTGFSWREVKSDYDGPPIGVDGIRTKGSDWEPVDEYLRMIDHPRAIEGFDADFAAMQKADTFVMVLPCGKSAHLELGWAIGAGKRTAILLEDPVEPELMYRGANYLTCSVFDLLGWLGVED